jgi:mono/diheme cytochrome c family protein
MGRPRASRAAAGALLLVLAPAALAGAADCGDGSGNWQAGRPIFRQTCSRCHGEDGRGARRGVPDLTAGVMAYSTASLAAHIEEGFRGPGRPLAMPPKGGNATLSHQDVSNVLAYLRHAFGCG